jgi:hypothetical protein
MRLILLLDVIQFLSLLLFNELSLAGPALLWPLMTNSAPEACRKGHRIQATSVMKEKINPLRIEAGLIDFGNNS